MKQYHSLGLRLDLIQQEVFLLDQQALPQQESWINATELQDMISCIQKLKVRGAPLIGVSAAVCLGFLAQRADSADSIRQAAQALRAARPTAVNLMWAMDHLSPLAETPQLLLETALKIFREDLELCQRMGAYGAELIAEGDGILTHCNTGGLATAGIGTALGVIRSAWEQGKKLQVYVDETRPLLQGGRLTAWELERLGIPYTLIADNMAASLMRAGQIQKIFVGADRIAVNGDFANKIGTYNVAVNAHYHQIPFYGVAPYSTIDPACPDGTQIPIEERAADEVRGASGSFGSVIWAPAEARVWNPAFDVTPQALITALVTDRGVFKQEQLRAGILKSLHQTSN